MFIGFYTIMLMHQLHGKHIFICSLISTYYTIHIFTCSRAGFIECAPCIIGKFQPSKCNFPSFLTVNAFFVQMNRRPSPRDPPFPRKSQKSLTAVDLFVCFVFSCCSLCRYWAFRVLSLWLAINCVPFLTIACDSVTCARCDEYFVESLPTQKKGEIHMHTYLSRSIEQSIRFGLVSQKSRT